ncbi:MAG: hypothetical protein NC041_05675 [Bacteroides sp.]|nr:hypothetical protein [Prevotella sp.]MCM1407446.1 hypothetical protein [Treponema brennaborense]MCM1469936.1 hypothetical protein [Bacteroides sp.]
MINTYNENSLHLKLKNDYAEKTNGKTEQKIGRYICDVLTPENTIIEIQTKNLGKLKQKLHFFLRNYSVLLVYPVACTTYIERRRNDGTHIAARKSPKKNDIYTALRELLGLHQLLLDPNFTLEILLTTQTEIRIQTEKPVQLINKSRRHLKNWYTDEKILNEIHGIKTFSSAADYLALLPAHIAEPFCAKNIQDTGICADAHCLLWLLHKTGLIRLTEIKGKTKFYCRTEGDF